MNKIVLSFSLLLVAAAFVGAGCTSSTDNTAATNSDANRTNGQHTSSATITMEEVAQHNDADDCWMVIDGNVYDVTEYISSHPGGQEITRGCGIDASRYFNEQDHSATANAIKEKHHIGALSE